MEDFTFDFPSYTIGKDAYKKVDEICSLYGKKAIVIGGKRAISKARPYLERDLKKISIIKYHVFQGEASFEACDEIAAIPMMRSSDSLNLAVATGIMLYQIFNRHRTQQS